MGPPLSRLFLSPGGRTDRTGRTGVTGYSLRAFYARPIEHAHVVKLKAIREKSRTEKPLFDDISMEAYGFNYNAWLKQTELAAPVMSMDGKKTTFGNIVSNRRDGAFTFKIVERTSKKMKEALYDYITNMFDLGLAKVFVKRKTYELISGINSTQDLDEFITAKMKGKQQLIFRISW